MVNWSPHPRTPYPVCLSVDFSVSCRPNGLFRLFSSSRDQSWAIFIAIMWKKVYMSKRFQCWLGNTKLALPFPMIFRMTSNVSCKSFCCYSRTPSTPAISPFSRWKSCKPPEHIAGSKRHQTSIIEHRRRQHYTYDFVESAPLLKQLMYVTIRETFETQSSQRGLYSGILTWFL